MVKDIDMNYLNNYDFGMNGAQTIQKVGLDLSTNVGKPEGTVLLSHLLSGEGILGKIAIVIDNSDKSFAFYYYSSELKHLSAVTDDVVQGFLLEVLHNFIEADKQMRGII